jgi:hypothetical protein
MGRTVIVKGVAQNAQKANAVPTRIRRKAWVAKQFGGSKKSPDPRQFVSDRWSGFVLGLEGPVWVFRLRDSGSFSRPLARSPGTFFPRDAWGWFRLGGHERDLLSVRDNPVGRIRRLYRRTGAAYPDRQSHYYRAKREAFHGVSSEVSLGLIITAG